MTDTPSKWRATIAVHPAADMFPMMSDAELDVLAADIKKNGLAHKVTLWGPRCSEIENIKDFQLLDGRNRLEAMERAGIQVDLDRHFEFYFTDMKIDPYEYVVSANIHRRHLTAEQKRELIAKLLKANPEKSDRQFAKETGVSHPHVAKVRKELEKSGDVETVSTRTDTKGRKQPACREKIQRAEAITRKHAAETRKRREDYHEYMDEKISRFARKLIQLDAALARELWEIISEGGDPHQLMDDLQIGIAPHNNDDGLDIPDYLKRAAP
jgi:DNA-binding transcriptional regulator YhcF (GntR family)